MRAMLDDTPLVLNASTIASAVEAARLVAEKTGRVIIEATLDGTPIPSDVLAGVDEAGLNGESFDGADVRFTSADPRTLIGSVLRDVATAMAGARADHIATAELIQGGQVEAALPKLGTTLGVWRQMQEALGTGSSLLGRPLQAEMIDGVLIEASLQELAQRLGDLKRSVQTQDWSALSDSLAYDLPEQADRWGDLLNSLADQIER